jgi:hypothetical protein
MRSSPRLYHHPGRLRPARLRHNAIIAKRPHTSTYDLAGDGLRFAIFDTKVHNRVLRPLFAADQPQAHHPYARLPAAA